MHSRRWEAVSLVLTVEQVEEEEAVGKMGICFSADWLTPSAVVDERPTGLQPLRRLVAVAVDDTVGAVVDVTEANDKHSQSEEAGIDLSEL